MEPELALEPSDVLRRYESLQQLACILLAYPIADPSAHDDEEYVRPGRMKPNRALVWELYPR